MVDIFSLVNPGRLSGFETDTGNTEVDGYEYNNRIDLSRHN